MHILSILILLGMIISLVNIPRFSLACSSCLRYSSLPCFSLAEERGRVKDTIKKDTIKKDTIKIGVIDVHRLFEEFQGTTKAREKLQQEFDKEREELEKLEKEIEELQRTIKAEAVPKKQKEELGKKLEEALANYQRMVSAAQERLVIREKELTQEIMCQIYEAINKVAQEKALDLVLDKNSILFWGGGVIDIGEEVREKLK